MCNEIKITNKSQRAISNSFNISAAQSPALSTTRLSDEITIERAKTKKKVFVFRAAHIATKPHCLKRAGRIYDVSWMQFHCSIRRRVTFLYDTFHRIGLRQSSSVIDELRCTNNRFVLRRRPNGFQNTTGESIISVTDLHLQWTFFPALFLDDNSLRPLQTLHFGRLPQMKNRLLRRGD